MATEEDENAFVIDPEILHHGSALTRYKVKSGDTLENLAKRFGWTWQQLALLNWGTDQPREINRCLHRYLGCRKNAAGHYAFSDEDDPGILLLPAPLPLRAHRREGGVFRVARYPVED